MTLRTVLVAGLAFALMAGLTIWRLQDHDLDHRLSEPFGVMAAGNQLSGTIWHPDRTAIAVVALVHGDGAQDRTMSGGYAPMINELLDRGIAVASWDKPGVGDSAGNWLLQSMSDRTQETRSVLQLLSRGFEGLAIGAVGFSQAGWVLPALNSTDADFLILVGAAVSWQDQGEYFTRVRLRREGLGPQQINAVLSEQRDEDARAFGETATAADAPAGISSERWQFIRRNRDADARQALSTLELPLLSIWGAEDLNVDPTRNAAVFADLLGQRDAQTGITILPDATHGLLKAPAYNWQLTENWSLYAVVRFLLEGRHAFAPGALQAITDWVSEQSAP